MVAGARWPGLLRSAGMTTVMPGQSPHHADVLEGVVRDARRGRSRSPPPSPTIRTGSGAGPGRCE